MIDNRRRMMQLRDFTSLPMQATDIDAIIDVRGKAWVVMEYKLMDAEVNVGQRLALTRLCRDLEKIRPTLGIIASHDTPVYKDIDCGSCMVVEVWYQGMWHKSDAGHTVFQLVEHFINGNVLSL